CLLLFPLVLLALLSFTSAIGMFVSSLNVRYRDTQHLLTLALLTWFWLTPVVYPSALVWQALGRHPLYKFLYLANPLTDVVLGFQRALYGVVSPIVQQGGKATAIPVLAPVSVGWPAMLLGAVAVGWGGL